MIDADKYKEMFAQEANEHINNLNNLLLELERGYSKDHIDSLFRSAHTLKGMAAMMGYDNVKELCKSIENVFDRLRSNGITLTKEIASLLFNCFDLLQRLINENTELDVSQHINSLQAILDTANVADSVNSNENNIKMNTNDNNANATINTNSTLNANKESIEKSHNTTIRINLRDLDLLVNLVGELVIEKLKLKHAILERSDDIESILMSAERLISDLQHQTMKIRLISIDSIFNRFPRAVRDLATKLGKEVDLEINAPGIQLDISVLDAITEPLLHIIRNAVDHGLETPEEREKAGKRRSGKLRISASRIGDSVLIEIEDDGRGIDLERLVAKAIEKNLISKEEAAKMSEDDIIRLIGTPGLSTAKSVTDVSGRGVGMDVVFKQVENVGGSVKIDTIKGSGTKISIKVPLSISIISGLIIHIGGERYVIPAQNVVTTLSVSMNEIKTVHGREVVVYKEHLIPILKTSEKLGIESKDHNYIVIIDKGENYIGMLVDSFEYRNDIVVKQIDDRLLLGDRFHSSTIMSDGSVALILDTNEL